MQEIKMENKSQDEKVAERMRLADDIYCAAIEEHARFKEILEADLRAVISQALQEIEELDSVTGLETVLAALTPEVARKITALWDFSGPGTYDDPVKEDRYKNYSWARGMDRARLSYSAWLARKISEVVLGEKLQGPISEISQRIERAKEIIAQNGPVIIYNGTEIENSVVRNVMEREGIIIPREKVIIMGKGIDNTADQVRTFRLPEELHRPGGEIGIVSHAPHLARIIRMLSQY